MRTACVFIQSHCVTVAFGRWVRNATSHSNVEALPAHLLPFGALTVTTQPGTFVSQQSTFNMKLPADP